MIPGAGQMALSIVAHLKRTIGWLVRQFDSDVLTAQRNLAKQVHFCLIRTFLSGGWKRGDRQETNQRMGHIMKQCRAFHLVKSSFC
ncbi:hypothetical protein [Spirosoma linguale]